MEAGVLLVDFFGYLLPAALAADIDTTGVDFTLISFVCHLFFLQWFSDLRKPPKEKVLWGFHKTIQSFVRSATIVDKINKVSDQKNLSISHNEAITRNCISGFLWYNVFWWGLLRIENQKRHYFSLCKWLSIGGTTCDNKRISSLVRRHLLHIGVASPPSANESKRTLFWR